LRQSPPAAREDVAYRIELVEGGYEEVFDRIRVMADIILGKHSIFTIFSSERAARQRTPVEVGKILLFAQGQHLRRIQNNVQGRAR